MMDFEIALKDGGAEMAMRNLFPAGVESEKQPIEIYSLGHFAVVKDGKPLSFGARIPRKPMSLLKAALASGGMDVSSQELIGALWPDAEGDVARNAFDVALYRLRKLMGRNNAILLQAGKLSLNPSAVWVDAWELERIFTMLQTAVRDSQPTLASLVERMLKLYRGPFLSGESEPWLLPARERLRMKFHRHAGIAGLRLERDGGFDAAAETYQRALELDPLAEEFYRRLMLCHKQTGRIVEALAAYRRCRDLFSITLGIQPSDETQRVYRSLS
jgi:DNA-binding SARP family transcriptional activator